MTALIAGNSATGNPIADALLQLGVTGLALLALGWYSRSAIARERQTTDFERARADKAEERNLALQAEILSTITRVTEATTKSTDVITRSTEAQLRMSEVIGAAVAALHDRPSRRP